MSDFYDAFQELKGLEEATFSFDKPGILALKKYINDDGEEETTTITVTDPSAETVDDMKYDYDGEVILKCSICGGLISKEPSQVKVDEQTQLANVEEECPYCYNVGGYEVVGEVKVPETLEYEEVDEFGDRTNDTKVVEFDDDTLDDAVTESYELHSGTVVKCFSDHDKAEKYANSKGYELAEYGNLGGGIGGDFAYAYWNETGDRNDDELVIAYYAFDDDGKARPLTEREKRYIAQEQVVEFDDDTLDVDSDNITVENKSVTEGLNEDVSVDKLAKFIEEAVEGLKDGEYTNYSYKFDDRFALFVGWSKGYDEDDDTVIHDEEDPEFAIVAGIKVWTSDYVGTDFDWLNYPYVEGGDVIDDSMTISPVADYHKLAQDFLDDYNDDYKDLKVTKDGLVVEHDDDEEAPYKITYYYDDSFDYDNSDTETYDTFEEVRDVFNSRKNDDGVFAIEVENNDGDVILSYSKDETKNESLSEDVSGGKGDFTDLFVNFLYSTEFALDKDEDGYYLVDLQGANLGNINKDRFQSAEEIFDRMEVYIEDYFVDDLEDWAEYYKIELPGSYEEMLHFINDNDEYPLTDNEKYSYEVLDMVVNHYDDIDLEKALKSFNKNVNEGVEDWRSNVIEFPSGDYVYVGFEKGKLFAGSATNNGIIHEYEIDIDGDEPTDSDLQDLYDMIVDEHPEYEEEITESFKGGKPRSLRESVKLISDLSDYEPWSGAVDTWDKIVEADAVDTLDAYLEEMYPEGLTMTQLNDLLWFDGDSVLADLGISEEEDDDWDEDDDIDEESEDEEDVDDDEVEESLNESRGNSYRSNSTGVEAEWYKKSTRNYNYEYVDLTVDGETATGRDKWINRPWYKFTFANAFKGAAKQLGYYEAAKEAVDAASSIEEAVKYFAEHYKEEKELTEAVDNIQITTDSDVANIDLNGSDSVNVSINPKEDGGDEEFVGDITDEPTIQPIDDETQAEIETNSEEESEEDGDSSGDETAEEEVDEFDETDFDELGESYLKSVYNNVESFKTTKGYLDKDKIKLEGIISFKSGKKAKTSFVFEGYSKTARGKYKMIGENLQLTSRKNAFILTGSVKNRKLCLEALTYNYSAKDAKSGKSVRVYGTKRVK